MRSVLFSVIVCCFVLTEATKPRSVNIALETSLLFNPDEEHNPSFINKIRHFIDQIEKAITPVKAFLRTTYGKDKIFTEFLAKVIAVLVKYDDKDLKKVTKLLTEEVEILFDNTDIFNEDTQRKILGILRNLQMKSNKIRSNLHNLLNSNDTLLYESFVKLNHYFNDIDKSKLDDVVEKLTERANFKEVVKSFVDIIHDKYESLSNTDRKKVDQDLHNLFGHIEIVSGGDINESKVRKLENFEENSTESNYLNKPDEIFINKDVEVSVRAAKTMGEENYSKYKDFKQTALKFLLMKTTLTDLE